jgi:hypothetical protein
MEVSFLRGGGLRRKGLGDVCKGVRDCSCG